MSKKRKINIIFFLCSETLETTNTCIKIISNYYIISLINIILVMVIDLPVAFVEDIVFPWELFFLDGFHSNASSKFHGFHLIVPKIASPIIELCIFN